MATPAKGPAPVSGYSFVPWIWHRKRVWIPGLLFIMFWLFKSPITDWLFHQPLNKHYPNLIQGLIIVILLVFSLPPITKPRVRPYVSQGDKFDIARKATISFYVFWLGLLLSWIAFYAVAYYSKKEISPVLDRVNGVEAIFLFLAYSEMTVITLGERGKPKFTAWRRILVALAIYGILAAWEQFSNPQAGPWWNLVSGLTVGVSMALLVGRFESRHIAAPLPITALLFLYASLQATYPMFGKASELEQIVTYTSLPLKILFFLIVDWIYMGGRLFYYMAKAREALEEKDGTNRLEDEWNAFWQGVPPPATPSNVWGIFKLF